MPPKKLPIGFGRVDGAKVLCGCLIDSPPPQEALFSGSVSNNTLRFWDCFYPLEALRSGMHHPDGALWIRTPSRRHATMARKVSLREIAPTLLSCAGINTDQTFAFPAIKEVSQSLERELAGC